MVGHHRSNLCLHMVKRGVFIDAIVVMAALPPPPPQPPASVSPANAQDCITMVKTYLGSGFLFLLPALEGAVASNATVNAPMQRSRGHAEEDTAPSKAAILPRGTASWSGHEGGYNKGEWSRPQVRTGRQHGVQGGSVKIRQQGGGSRAWRSVHGVSYWLCIGKCRGVQRNGLQG